MAVGRASGMDVDALKKQADADAAKAKAKAKAVAADRAAARKPAEQTPVGR